MAHSTPEFFSKHHIARNRSIANLSHSAEAGFCSPNPQSVRNILAYSKALEVKPSGNIENVSVVLN